VRATRISVIADAGSFSVGHALKNGTSVLTHHGVANLPGKITIAVERENQREKSQIRKSLVVESRNELPTVFHITHWKAGSQWLYKILREIAPDRIVAPQLYEKQFMEKPLQRGGIYPTLYLTKELFHSVSLPDNYRKFIIVRDLRDTLISAYFSTRFSHEIMNEQIAKWRQQLKAMDMEKGLLLMMDEWLPFSASIHESWIEAGEKLLRYEDMLKNDSEILEEVLIKECEIQVSPERLREIVAANRFENLTGGRKPGEENLMAHERKGVSGDWRNYFTQNIAEEFDRRYGELLVKTGYAPTILRKSERQIFVNDSLAV
jgi:hypothetical protein